MNPLIPTPLEAVMIALCLAGYAIVAVAVLTALWIALVPKRRTQAFKILFSSKS